MIQTILIALSCLLLLIIIFRKTDNGAAIIQRKVEDLEKALNRIEQSLREDFRMNRCLSPLNDWTDFLIQFRTLNLGNHEYKTSKLEC